VFYIILLHTLFAYFCVGKCSLTMFLFLN
jgi:hypothetical protein